MFKIEILGEHYEAPMNLEEVPVSRFRTYLLQAEKRKPEDDVRRVEVSRAKAGWFGWKSKLEDRIRGKRIEVLYSEDPEENEKILQQWDEFARWEVGFWFKIPRSVLDQVPQESIDQTHQFLGAHIIPPDPEPGFSSFQWRGKAYFIDYTIEEVADLADVEIGSGVFLELISRICKTSDRKTKKPGFWKELPTSIAFAVAYAFEERAKLATGYLGKVIQDSLLYGKGSMNDIAKRDDKKFGLFHQANP